MVDLHLYRKAGQITFKKMEDILVSKIRGHLSKIEDNQARRGDFGGEGEKILQFSRVFEFFQTKNLKISPRKISSYAPKDNGMK